MILGRSNYRVAGCEIDFTEGCIRRDGREQHLRQQTLQVLRYLLENRERLVTKEELVQNIWQGAAVTDNAIVQCIADLRKALGDDARQPRLIKTFPKVGYRFIGHAEAIPGNHSVHAVAEEIADKTVEVASGQPLSGARPRYVRRLPRILMVVSAVLAASLSIYLAQSLKRLDPPADTALPQIPGKKAIVVTYFENRSRTADLNWLREGLADMLIADFARSPELTVLNREQLRALLDALGYDAAEKVGREHALYIGQRSRADVVVHGGFARLDENVAVNVQLYDAVNGSLLAEERVIIENSGDLRAQIELLGMKLAADLGANLELPGEACTPTPAGIVGWWPGENNARDLIGNNHGATQSETGFVPGRVGRAFDLAGERTSIRVPDAPALNFAPDTPISVELWAYRTGDEPIMHLFGKRSGCYDEPSPCNYQLAFNNKTRQGLVFGTAETGIDLPRNQWIHLAGTFDGSTYRFYIDGLLVAKEPGAMEPLINAPLIIGGSGDCIPFTGMIDEVSLYRCALAAEEIRSIFRAGRSGKCKPRGAPVPTSGN